MAFAAGPGAGADRSPAKSRPNILFAIADDWSHGHAGAYGCRWTSTPAFDRVAREGLLFANAYTPCSKCSPSRSSILTGRNPWQLKAAANHSPFFPPEFKTWPEALGEHGYFVGLTGKGWGPGVASDSRGKPRQMAGVPFAKFKAPKPTATSSDNDYARNFEDFLDSAPPDKPWCFWYGGQEPHRGYAYGSGVAKGGKKPSDIDRVPAYWPDNARVRNDMLDYAFEVEHFDRHLGGMLDLLGKRGLADNTLVVVTSDNGMPFPRCKGFAYEESNHLPLAIRWPRAIPRPGRTVEGFVSFIDFAPTVIEAAGLRWEQTGMAPTTGTGMANIFAGKADGTRTHVLIGKERNDVGRPHDWGYPIRGIVTNGMLYLHNFEPSRWPAGNPETGYLDSDDSPTKSEILALRNIEGRKLFWDACFGMLPADQVYDLRRDPDCLENLAGKADFKPLQKLLFDDLKAQGDPRLLGQANLFDEATYSGAQRGLYDRREKKKAPPDNDK